MEHIGATYLTKGTCNRTLHCAKNETNSHGHFRVSFAFSRVSGGFEFLSKILGDSLAEKGQKGSDVGGR